MQLEGAVVGEEEAALGEEALEGEAEGEEAVSGVRGGGVEDGGSGCGVHGVEGCEGEGELWWWG